MRKLSTFLVLTFVTILLCNGCTAPVELTEPPKAVSWLLDYPGLSWGMSPDEVRTALEVTDAQETNGDYLVLHDIRRTVFGSEDADIYLYFTDRDNDGICRLFRVMAVLPHDADLDAIARQIEAYYGVAPEYNEKVRLDSDNSSVNVRCWDWGSEAVMEDVYSKSDIEYIQSLEVFYQRTLTDPVTRIKLENDGYFDLTLDGISTRNLLTFTSMYTTYQLEGVTYQYGEGSGASVGSDAPTE